MRTYKLRQKEVAVRYTGKVEIKWTKSREIWTIIQWKILATSKETVLKIVQVMRGTSKVDKT